MVSTRNSAECTALRAHTMPTAQTSASGARSQKTTASPVPTVAAARSAWFMTPPLFPRSRAGARRRAKRSRRPFPGRVLGAHRGTRVGQRADVVVLLVLAQAHVVRRLLHARQQRREQLLLGEDQILAVVAGQLVLVAHRQRAGRAGLDAQAAEDAAGIVDLVHGGVPLTRRVPRALGVVAALDVDRVGRAGPGAQFAADALLQPVRVAVEDVPAVEARGGRGPYIPVLLRGHPLGHVRAWD